MRDEGKVAVAPAVEVGFFCVGGNKCGTTWLSEMLRQHPGLNVSANKEPQFFTRNWDKGWDWYARSWTHNGGLKGEFSTSYLHNPLAIERLSKYYPDARILVLLRQPLDRAISHFRHLLRENQPEDYDLFLKENTTVVRCSIYAAKLKLIEKSFPPQQVKVLPFDRIKTQPHECLREVFSFLDVDPAFHPARLEEAIGKGFVPRSRTVEELRARTYRLLQKKELYGVIVFLKKIGFAAWIRRVNAVQHDDAGIRAALLPYIPRFQADLEELRTSPLIADPRVINGWLQDLRRATES